MYDSIYVYKQQAECKCGAHITIMNDGDGQGNGGDYVPCAYEGRPHHREGGDMMACPECGAHLTAPNWDVEVA